MSNVTAAMNMCQRIHGLRATNWIHLDQHISLNNLNRIIFAKRTGFPLQKHYVFIPLEWNLQNDFGEAIIMIRTTPFRENTRSAETAVGRYAIVLKRPIETDADAESRNNPSVHLRWIPEPKVQKILAKAKIQLPPTDFEAARAAEAAVRKSIEEREAADRIATFYTYKLRLLDGLNSIKALFIAPSATNTQNSGAAAPITSRIRILPAAFLLAFLSVMGILFFRRFVQSQRNPPAGD